MDIHITILYLFVGLAVTIGMIGIVMGIKKIAGAPFITVVAGLLLVILIIFIEDVTVGYNDRQIERVTIEAFEAGEDITIVRASQTSSNLATQMYNGISTNIINAQLVDTVDSALVGLNIDTIEVRLAKVGSPTGLLYVCIFDNTGACIEAFGTKDSATLTTTMTSYNFTKTGDDYTIAVGDYIGVKYDNGSSVNHVTTNINNGDVYDSIDSFLTQFADAPTTAWGEATGFDFRFRLLDTDTTIQGDEIQTYTYDNSNEPITEPFNQNDSWVFTILLAMMFMFIGIMLQYQTWGKQ